MNSAGLPGSSHPDNAGLNVFALELRRWRDVRGYSRTALARAMGYDRSYVSKVESGTERPSREFAAHAETALHAGGALHNAFREFIAAHTANPSRPQVPEPTETAGAGSLIVDHDDATLHYDGTTYRLTQRRHLINGGQEPITRYMIRISVDRHPGDPERSNQLYSEHPLAWTEIDLHAWHGGDRTEAMHWTAHHDRAAFKEVWLLFANDSRHFPLYPGDSTWIEYEYTVSDEHWGNWFQRTVRLPTRALSVRLDFPAELNPTVWGLHTSLAAQALPFPTPITQQRTEERHTFSWSCQLPPLHSRYRLEWDFRTKSPRPSTRPSEAMRSLGVLQAGDPLLHRPARPFQLPTEADDARRVVTALHSAAERIAKVHTFGKGLGIAAPQIGIDRAAALIRTPDGQTITLFNPTIIETAGDTDDHYEGCLSFFDVRGQVPRPQRINVEHTDIDGNTRITIFERGTARLVAHEIDHLHGILYTDRMRPEIQPIPIEQYRGTGTNWHY